MYAYCLGFRPTVYSIKYHVKCNIITGFDSAEISPKRTGGLCAIRLLLQLQLRPASLRGSTRGGSGSSSLGGSIAGGSGSGSGAASRLPPIGCWRGWFIAARHGAMVLNDGVQAWVPSPGATWQEVKTPLELATERLARGLPWAVQVDALKLLASRRGPITFDRKELVSTDDVRRLAPDVLGCLADDHWRVREAALDTLRVWGLQAFGEAAVAEVAEKVEKARLDEEKRNTPMRTYAEAHAVERYKGVTANVGTLVLAGTWAERGRLLVRRKPEAGTFKIDLTERQGDGRQRDGGSGRTQEIFIVCPPNQRAGSVVTVRTQASPHDSFIFGEISSLIALDCFQVVTADGGTVDATVPYVLDAVCFVYTCRRLIDLSLMLSALCIHAGG